MRKKTLQELMKERANQSTDTSAYTDKPMQKSNNSSSVIPINNAQENSTWNKIQIRANQIMNNSMKYIGDTVQTRFTFEPINNLKNVDRNRISTANYTIENNIDKNENILDGFIYNSKIKNKLKQQQDQTINNIPDYKEIRNRDNFYNHNDTLIKSKKDESWGDLLVDGKVISKETAKYLPQVGKAVVLGGKQGIEDAGQFLSETVPEQRSSEYKYRNMQRKVLERKKAIRENINNIDNPDIGKNMFEVAKQKDQKIIDNIIENSPDILSKKLSELAPSTGRTVVGTGLSLVPGIGQELSGVYFFSSSGQSYFDEAKSRGMKDEDAYTYSTIMSLWELGSEKYITGERANQIKTILSGEDLNKSIKSILSNEIVENALQEGLTEYVDVLATKLSGGNQYIQKEVHKRALQSAFDGALQGLIMGTPTATLKTASDVKKHIQNQIKEKGEKVVANEMLSNAKLTLATIENNMVEKANNGILNFQYSNLDNERISQIENSELNQNQIQKLLEISNKYDLDQKDIQDLIDGTKNGKYTENQPTTMQNKAVLNQEQQTIQKEGKQAQNQLSQEIGDIEQKVLNLRQSIDNFNNSRTEGQEIFDINNEETRKEIESIQKIVEDRNINIRFDENRFKDNSQNAFYEYDENGNVANIILNPNATTKKYVENLAIHELVHSFSGDKKANLMKDVLNYAKTLEGYDKAYQDIKSNYEKVYGKNVSEDVINEEAVANILGEKLGNKEFVNDLVNGKYSTQNRNFVQKIYDFVKNQINRFKGYKNQEQYWTHIKELFDDAYRNSEVSQEGIKASVERNITDNKQKQLDIIKESNPMTDEYHTGIRTIDDIKTFEEAIQDEESFVYGDYSKEDAERDLKNGTVTVYSSKPIEQGGFVSTSKNMAKDYAGNGQVYSQKVNINDVAWINGDEGQYAKVKPKVDENKAYQKMIDDVANSLRVTNKTNELDIYGKARQLASNEFKKLTTDEDYDNYNKRIEEIEKDLTERLSQKDTNIKYSQDTTGAWNNFIEKYFKNEGTGTSIKDMKKLPEMSITKYQEVLDNAKYIPQEEKTNLLQEVQNIKRNKSSLDEFKNLVNDMNNVYKEENTLNTKETYLTGRKEKYQKYLNSKTEYDNSALKNAMEIIPANNQGRRTKEQWLNVAKQIGTEIANKSNQEIEEIAFRTWQDERPSSKESLNRQGNKFVGFNSDEWINAIYDSVNEQRQYSVDTEQQAENQAEQQENVEQQTQQPVEQTVKEEKTRKKILNPTEISNLKPEDANTTPELKDKKYKKGTKESNFAENIENDVGFLTEEQKKEILKDDNVKYYAPVTNADTLAKAYQDLKENGQNATLEWYSKDGKTSSAEDVAKGWILLKQYADKGDTQGMVNVAKKLRDMGTKAGQTVQAFNILSRLTPEGMVAYTQGELQDAYNEMVKGKTKKWIDQHKGDFDLSQEEVAFIMDTMQNLPAENPDTNNYERKVALGQIQKLFTDKIPVEGGKIKAWMRISMLFNPKTQVRNVAGNVGIVPVNAVADFLGSKVDKAVAKKTGVRTLGNPNVKSYLKGAKQGLYQSYNDFRLGINTRGLEGSKFEFGEGKSFKDKGIGKALNRTENILNFVMDAGDRAFSQGSFTNSLNNQMVLNGVDTPTQEMIDIATQEALSRTWNDNNEYTNFVLGIRKGLNKIGTKNYGLGDVLIPFAKTPANLTKAIVDYSPVGLVNAIKEGNNLKNAIETGQFTPMQQHKFVDSLGKALAGTMLYVIGYGLAKAGIATGEADEDKDVKNFMKNSLGIGSYSIKIGNKSFAYDWAQPVATPIAIMTNLYQTNKNNSDATILEKALNAVNIGTNQIMEQSFMDSLNEVLNGNGEITERLQKAVLDLPARAIPTFSKQIADLVDSTQRTSFEYGKPLQSSINAVKAKIPFASKTLTPVVDTLGNEVKRYGGENNVFNVFLNPANMNKGQLSKAGKEIYNVYMQTGDTTVFPVTAPYYVNYKGNKLTMTAQERADYQRISGKYTEEVMNKLLNNSNYKSLSDEDKAEIISKVINDSNSKAKKDVLNISNKDIDKIEKIGSNYYDYKLDTKKALDKKRQETGKTTTQLTDNEKISVLKNKNYSKKEKDLLYTNEIGDDDTVYTSMKLLNGNSLSFIDSYFDYKMGSKKSDDLKQFLNNNNQLTYMQKLYLTGVNNSSLNSTERQKLKNYIYSLNITEQQRKTMENKLKFTTEMKDGSYKWK